MFPLLVSRSGRARELSGTCGLMVPINMILELTDTHEATTSCTSATVTRPPGNGDSLIFLTIEGLDFWLGEASNYNFVWRRQDSGRQAEIPSPPSLTDIWAGNHQGTWVCEMRWRVNR